MQFNGRLGIISGRYHSLDASNGGKEHQTILEVFGRCEDGRSICLLIKGLQPSFEITPLSAWQAGQEIPEQLKARVKVIADKEDVVKIEGPTMKLTDLGMRPIWRVTTRQPYVVPNLRKTLEKQGWGVYSGDIPFLNRLFLDLDLSIHIHLLGGRDLKWPPG